MLRRENPQEQHSHNRHCQRRKVNSTKDYTTSSSKDNCRKEEREAHKNRGYSCMTSITKTFRGTKYSKITENDERNTCEPKVDTRHLRELSK